MAARLGPDLKVGMIVTNVNLRYRGHALYRIIELDSLCATLRAAILPPGDTWEDFDRETHACKDRVRIESRDVLGEVPAMEVLAQIAAMVDGEEPDLPDS